MPSPSPYTLRAEWQPPSETPGVGPPAEIPDPPAEQPEPGTPEEPQRPDEPPPAAPPESRLASPGAGRGARGLNG